MFMQRRKPLDFNTYPLYSNLERLTDASSMMATAQCQASKTDQNEWNVGGHLHRVLDIDEKTLELFAQLYDRPETPWLEARLPTLHARELVQRAAKARRLSDSSARYPGPV